MAQFYPEGMCDMNLSRANEAGGLVTPPPENFQTDAMRGSMQEILSDNLGQYVVCEFIVGTQAMTRKEGILYSVGRAYITLFEEAQQTFVVCDIFSIKFVTFYMPGQRPGGRNTSAAANAPMMSTPSLDSGAGQYSLGTGVRSSTLRDVPGNRVLGR